MAKLNKTVTGYNLHQFALTLQEEIVNGWRVDPMVVARRSLGNRFTIALTKESDEAVNVEAEKKVFESAGDAGVQATDEEVKVETEVEKPAKPLTKAQLAKLAKEEAKGNGAE